MSGRRTLSLATLAMALAISGLWIASGDYFYASLWGVVAVVWLIRTVTVWGKPPLPASKNPGRDQLLFGALLALGLLTWFVWSPSSPFASG
jgi:hypothetical protein